MCLTMSGDRTRVEAADTASAPSARMNRRRTRTLRELPREEVENTPALARIRAYREWWAITERLSRV